VNLEPIQPHRHFKSITKRSFEWYDKGKEKKGES
jgi:hypothetical protein